MFSPTVYWNNIQSASEGEVMGQILHGSARTAAAVRRAIQHSQESLSVLAERHGINEKTVAKWKRRNFVHDAPMGPKKPASTALSTQEEAAVVAVPALHAFASGRLSLRLTAKYSSSDQIEPAPLLATARHIASAEDRR